MILVGLRPQGADDSESSPKHRRSNDDIIFSREDLWGVQTLHNDTIVVLLTIANYDVKWYLIDNKSSVDVIFYDSFSRMELSIDRLKPINALLIGFTGDSIKIEEKIELSITVGRPLQQSIVQLNFFIVWVSSIYNVILG